MAAAAGMLVTLGLGAGAVTFAQTATTTNSPASAVTAAATGSATADATAAKPQGHRPLGNDGIISSINGTSIVMAEEADEGGASYTVDASNATFTNNGAAATLADLKVGDKIFVEGTTNGTTVVATSVSLGHGGPGMGGHGRPNDNDADDTSATPSTTTTTTTGQ